MLSSQKCIPSLHLVSTFKLRNGNPLQYSCLENPMNGGAWWATVHGVAKSWTGLSNFTFTLRHTSATPHSILFILSTGFIMFHCVPGILFPNWMTTP